MENKNMIKITEESIKEHLIISRGWKKRNVSYAYLLEYHSSDNRYRLVRTDFSNLGSDEDGGWRLFIDDSKYCSLACCDVEYIEQIFALIDVYKDY